MDKPNRLFVLLALMVAALSFTACGGDDVEEDNENTALSYAELKGTWTTVAVERASSHSEEELMAYSFMVYWDDGYMIDIYDNSYYWGFLLENFEIKEEDSNNVLIKILSYDKNGMKVCVPKYDNAILVMKKLGTLTNEDYKNKLCYGYWLDCLDQDVLHVMDYDILHDGKTIQQTADMYGERFQLVEFNSNGTGNCYCDKSEYSFTWSLIDKNLSIKTSRGEEKTTKLTFIGIEGRVFLKYEATFGYWI